MFETFDAEPLGTASLAQVHRATLKNGQEVAVKVQHPYVLGNSKVDMKTMEYLCKIMSIVFPDFKMQWLVDESKKNLPIELDFLNEGRNAEKVRCTNVFPSIIIVSPIFVFVSSSGSQNVQRLQMAQSAENILGNFDKTCFGHGIFDRWTSE